MKEDVVIYEVCQLSLEFGVSARITLTGAGFGTNNHLLCLLLPVSFWEEWSGRVLRKKLMTGPKFGFRAFVNPNHAQPELI
jgi:hypothetical protein